MAQPAIVVPQGGFPAKRILSLPQVRPVPIHLVARLAFWAIFLLSLTNALGLLVVYLKRLYGEQFELGIQPVAFAIASVFVFAFSRGGPSSPMLMAAWTLWLAYFLGGFLGTEQSTARDFRHMLQVTVKPWITLVGLPWLALRAIAEDKLPRLLRATVIVTSIGAVLGLLQLAFPGFMSEVMMAADRASGFWVEPNVGGYLCTMVLFLSFICPFRVRWINWAARLLLLASVVASLSRASLLALVLGWIVYGLATKRFTTLIKSAIGLALFATVLLSAVEFLQAFSPQSGARVSILRSFLEGDWSAHGTDNRTEIWKGTLRVIVDKGGLIVGLGHGAMSGTVEGLSPHNYYLWVWGNSGILALLALLAFKVVLFQQAWRCTKRETRAALLAVATVLAVVHMFDGAVADRPFVGAVLACMAVAICCGKAKPTHQRYPSPSLAVVRSRPGA